LRTVPHNFGRFKTTTRLSLVLAAAAETEPGRDDALADLCRIYWQPLYSFVRSRGYNHEEAQDLTQSFIARILEKNILRKFQHERGRYRSFLLGALKHFLAHARDAAHAQKRGGDAPRVPISQIDLPGDPAPDKVFEKQWALALINRVLCQLQQEALREGSPDRFARLSGCITAADDHVPYREIARRLDMTEGAVKVAIHRLRRRFHDALRHEISLTVTEEREISEEIRYLLAALQN